MTVELSNHIKATRQLQSAFVVLAGRKVFSEKSSDLKDRILFSNQKKILEDVLLLDEGINETTDTGCLS